MKRIVPSLSLQFLYILIAIFVCFLPFGTAQAKALYPAEKPIVITNPMSPQNYSLSYTAPVNKFVKKEIDFGPLGKRTYYLYVPENLNKTKKPGLVLLLHGAERNGASMIDKWNGLAKKSGFIIVAPDATGSAWNFSPTELEFLVMLTDMIGKHFGTDTARTYVFGHSNGAILAIVMAAMQSDRFAAAGLHAGSLAPDKVQQLSKNMRPGMPVILIVGTNDDIFPLANVRATAEALRQAGAKVTQYEISPHNHWYYDLAEYINTIAWNEMQKYSLPGR